MSTAHSLGSPCTAASALREERANLRHRTRVECRPIGAPPLDVRTTILINQRSRIQHLQLIQSLVHTALRVRAQCHMKGNDLAHSRGHGRAKCGGAAAFTLLSAQPGQSKSSFWQVFNKGNRQRSRRLQQLQLAFHREKGCKLVVYHIDETPTSLLREEHF